MSDTQDKPLSAADKRAAAKEAANKPSPIPIEFFARDRFHAITHVLRAQPLVAEEVKDRLCTALGGVAHRGPVHVAIPAPQGAVFAREGTPGAVVTDPLRPEDGAFLITPFEFVRV